MGTKGIYGIVADGKCYVQYQSHDMYPEGHPARLVKHLSEMPCEQRDRLREQITQQSWIEPDDNPAGLHAERAEALKASRGQMHLTVARLEYLKADYKKSLSRARPTAEQFRDATAFADARIDAAADPDNSQHRKEVGTLKKRGLLLKPGKAIRHDSAWNAYLYYRQEPDWADWAGQSVALKEVPEPERGWITDELTSMVLIDYDDGMVRVQSVHDGQDSPYSFDLAADLHDTEALQRAAAVLNDYRIGPEHDLDTDAAAEAIQTEMRRYYTALHGRRFGPAAAGVDTRISLLELEDGMWRRPPGWPELPKTNGTLVSGYDRADGPNGTATTSRARSDPGAKQCGMPTLGGMPCKRLVRVGGACPQHGG